MDEQQLFNSLLTWFCTFDHKFAVKNAEDLIDGIATSHVLHQIAPNFFTDVWTNKMKTDASNWRIKVINLKRILQGILDFYSEVLGQHILDFRLPDVNAIGEHIDLGELGRLLQLILGCAINCDDKQEYIKRIMLMEETVQHVVMNAIQELMMKETKRDREESFSEMTDQLKHAMEEINGLIESKEEISQRCHELDCQVSQLQEEKSCLMVENDRLNERLNQAENMEFSSSHAGRRFQQLQSQIEQLQDDLFKVEATKDDLRIKLELQEKVISELQQRNDDLSTLAEAARGMKDEMDVLKHTSDKVSKYEAQIETMRKKMTELVDLKAQIKILEEKNTSYMETNLQLEEEVRKGGTIKSQMELYKRQVQELQIKMVDEIKRADKAEFEINRLNEKMTTLLREKENLVYERDSLKETNEELSDHYQTGLSIDPESNISFNDSSSLDMVDISPVIKEKIVRLQHENKMLLLERNASDSQQGQLLQSLLDDSNERKNELESECRILNQKIIELEAQIVDLNELNKNANLNSDNEVGNLRKKINDYQKTISISESDICSKQKAIIDLESQINIANTKIDDMQEQLSKKETAMKSMEDRYKLYLEKAKTVIHSLDPKFKQPSSATEIQALKNQIQEKEKLVEHLEKDHAKTKNIREEEDKCIVGAWYHLGMQLHRMATEERLASNSPAGLSFLARQRQAHTRKPSTDINSSTHINSSR